MKKLLCIVMAIIMLCLCSATLVACGKGGDETTTKKDPTPIPTSYKKFDNGDIYFGYPDMWGKVEQNGITVLVGSENTNNITVVSEAKTSLYENMDVDEFNTLIKPQMTAQGISVSNVAISNVTNENGIKITKITLTASAQGITMSQTLFALSTDDKTYCVTVTEAVSDATLVNNVFETLNYSE